MAEAQRDLKWESDTRRVLRTFPDTIKWAFGRALYRAELGKRPGNASSLRGRLGGIMELAANYMTNTYRLYYTVKCPGAVYVLYCHKRSRPNDE